MTLGLQWHSHGRGGAYHSPTDMNTAHTYGNKPVEWRRGLYCTNRHYYRNDLG